ETTPLVAAEAIAAAREHGTIVSYDLNYRPSLWRSIGGREKAQEVNRGLAPKIDVMLGNEEDFRDALGVEIDGLTANASALDPRQFRRMIEGAVKEFPNLQVVATSLRVVKSASVNDWGAICYDAGEFHQATLREGLDVLDRVGGGDSFASGLIYGFLTEQGAARAVEYGAAHGALAVTTPGDTSMATLKEVEGLIAGAGARIQR
nr:sugar kinase [Acidobacteriota bacterium]